MRDILYSSIVANSCNRVVTDRGTHYTYEALLDDVHAFDKIVSDSTGSHIVMSAERSYTSVALYVYSVINGYTLVPVSTKIDSQSLERLMCELSVKFFYTDNAESDLIDVVRRCKKNVVVADNSRMLSDSVVYHYALVGYVGSADNNNDNKDVYLIFTSGSTGNPKGVVVGEDNLLAYMRSTKKYFGFNNKDVFGHISPLTFDFSIHEIFLALFSGATIAVLRENDKFNLANYISDNAITVWSSVPSTVSFLHQSKKLKKGAFEKLKIAFIGGEPVSVDLLQKFSEAAPGCSVFSYYGPTECTVAMMSCEYIPGGEYGQYMPLGLPFGEHKLLIEDKKTGVLSEHGYGDGYIVGPQVLDRYWNNKQESQKKFFVHEVYGKMFKTGDIVSREEGGIYHFMGRDDDDLKIGGYRFDAAACREFIKEISCADEVLVFVYKGQDSVRIAELFVITLNSKISASRVAMKFRDNYDNYLQPRFYDTQHLPTNANGKVDKKLLLESVKSNA